MSASRRRAAAVLALSSAITVLLSFTPLHVCAGDFQVVSRIGGICKAVAVQGHYAYVGQGGELAILDLTNPENPVQVGSVQCAGTIASIAVNNGYAYVADYGVGMRIIDARNPAAPVAVGFYDSPGYALDVAASGNLAFLSDGISGLEILAAC